MAEFSQDLFDRICERIADGESLRSICSDADMPNKANVFRWLDGSEALRDQYARAREDQADAIFDEILDIADDARNDWMRRDGEDENGGYALNGEHVQRSKLRIDVRKWMAGKLKPKKYGDKIAIGGDEDAPPVKVAAQIDYTQLSTAALKELEGVLAKDDPSADNGRSAADQE